MFTKDQYNSALKTFHVLGARSIIDLYDIIEGRADFYMRMYTFLGWDGVQGRRILSSSSYSTVYRSAQPDTRISSSIA